MYCTVALSFQSERKPIKIVLTYKVGNHKVQVNDVVEVKYNNKLTYGVVSGLYSKDTHNPKEMTRIELERILHTNTIYAAVRRRFNMFKDYIVEKGSGKQAIQSIQSIHGDKYAVKIMKYVCLGNMIVEKDGSISIWHANQHLTFMQNTDGNIVLKSYKCHRLRTAWRTSIKAENYLNKLYEEYYGKS